MKTKKFTEEEKKQRAEARKVARLQQKENDKETAKRTQKPVKEITITIEWRKSYTWGSNPFCTAAVSYKDGTFERAGSYTASGCGYDKESTVIAEVFNNFLAYKLWQLDEGKRTDNRGLPYGFHISQWEHDGVKYDSRFYNGGIGTSCYYQISEAIGGKFECLASGKTFDVYKYTDNAIQG